MVGMPLSAVSVGVPIIADGACLRGAKVQERLRAAGVRTHAGRSGFHRLAA